MLDNHLFVWGVSIRRGVLNLKKALKRFLYMFFQPLELLKNVKNCYAGVKNCMFVELYGLGDC